MSQIDFHKIDTESFWFPFINFEAIYEVSLKEDIQPPLQIYSRFRGMFGKNLRKISCVLRNIKFCQDCKLNLSCAYSYLFETPNLPTIKKLKKYPYLPHPFSFSIPYSLFKSDKFESINEIKIHIVLIGKGIHFFPHVVFALKLLSEKFYPEKFEKFELKSLIDAVTKENILKKDKIKIPEPVSSNFARNLEINKLKIKIISPLALRFQEKLVKPENFDFSILIRNLIRRISNLAYFHCEKEINLDFKNIIKASQNVLTVKKDLELVRVKRKSQRTGQTYTMSGFIGEAVFEGNLTYFYPVLLLGSFVQVGKYTSFGFGKYELKLIKYS